MPKVKVTVNTPSGSDKENLQYILIGTGRWGPDNGAKYGTSIEIDAGNNIHCQAEYTRGRAESTESIQQDTTFDVVANGEGGTTFTQVP